MARPQKFPISRMVRITKETDKLLEKRAKIMGLAPAVVLRIIVTHSLTGQPIKEGQQDVAED